MIDLLWYQWVLMSAVVFAITYWCIAAGWRVPKDDGKVTVRPLQIYLRSGAVLEVDLTDMEIHHERKGSQVVSFSWTSLSASHGGRKLVNIQVDQIDAIVELPNVRR